MVTISQSIGQTYGRGFASIVLLLAMSGTRSAALGTLPSGLDLIEPAQERAEEMKVYRLAHARELLAGKMDARSRNSIASVESVNRFVLRYTEHRLETRAVAWKNHSWQIARAILEESSRYRLDPIFLLAVIENESRFRPDARGQAGEIGLMQIRPHTAQWIARKMGIAYKGAESLRDPATNIQLGTAYFVYLRSRVGSDRNLYLAAYNMGVKKLHQAMTAQLQPAVYVQRTLKEYRSIYMELARTLAPPVRAFAPHGTFESKWRSLSAWMNRT